LYALWRLQSRPSEINSQKTQGEVTRERCRQDRPAKFVVCNAADEQWRRQTMYGRRARWAGAQLPRELELTPNYAQGSLKTARPVRRSWAGYKIGVLPAELYIWDRAHRTGHAPG
jgi:hypothetical protein